MSIAKLQLSLPRTHARVSILQRTGNVVVNFDHSYIPGSSYIRGRSFSSLLSVLPSSCAAEESARKSYELHGSRRKERKGDFSHRVIKQTHCFRIIARHGWKHFLHLIHAHGKTWKCFAWKKKPEKTIKCNQQCIENFEREYRGETIDFNCGRRKEFKPLTNRIGKATLSSTAFKRLWSLAALLCMRTDDERFWNFEHAEKTSA